MVFIGLVLIAFVRADHPESFNPPNLGEIFKSYDVLFTHDLPDSFVPKDEESLQWSYFDRFSSWGLLTPESTPPVGRNFTTVIRAQQFVDIAFTLTFNAQTFKENYVAGVLEDALKTDDVNAGLAIGASDLNPDCSYRAQSNCNSQMLNTGETICGASLMSCAELSNSGEIMCSSYCAEDNIVEACGLNGLCNQTLNAQHECTCPPDTWWITGGDFGGSMDPCKPVLENWLIIVIGVLGFLLLILIIILIIYCCLNGCVCPCKCDCCKKEDDAELKYQVKNGSIGVNNSAFVNEPDSGSQRPLYDTQLTQEQLVKNPAVWYESNFTRKQEPKFDSFHTDAVVETVTLPPGTYSVTEERHRTREYSSHDPKHSHHRHRDDRDDRDGRSHHRRRRREKSPTRSPPNPYTSKMEREIEKLQEEIDTIKRDIDNGIADDTMTTIDSTIQAPVEPIGPIGEVIAELKARNNARAVKRKEAALDLSDEEVDPPLRKYESKTILVPENVYEDKPDELKATLKERWRVPALTVKPLEHGSSVSQVESSVI